LPSRKELITPIEKTIQQRYEEWLHFEYQGKEFREGVPMILTEKILGTKEIEGIIHRFLV